MKNNVLFVSFLALTQFVNAQCISDAGNDEHRCSLDSIVHLGGMPTASGGTPPYTYEWSIDPIPFTPPTKPYLYASDILDETTISNPTLVYNNVGDSLTFYLKVTDSLNCVSYDTMKLTTSYFGIHLGYWTYYIYQGDSVYLNDGPNVGCINRPCTYLWSPTHGLSDSILPSGFWAKPDYDIAYTPTATDSKGCSKTAGVTYYIYVRPVGIQSLKESSVIRIFPNPATDIINIEPDNNVQIQDLKLTDLNGQEISIEYLDNKIYLKNIPDGLYIIEVRMAKETVRSLIMKE